MHQSEDDVTGPLSKMGTSDPMEIAEFIKGFIKGKLENLRIPPSSVADRLKPGRTLLIF
jgi:hypothetical protein